jgi:predicted secreted protein
MSASVSVAVYFTMWWIVLFAVLPFGVRNASETDPRSGAPMPPAGADPGAPMAPMIAMKALWTTLISAALFALLYAYVALTA